MPAGRRQSRSTAFFDCIKERLAPLLRADGFLGSPRRFRRVRGEAVHVIEPQISSSGQKCVINLGVHLLFLPIYDGSLPDPRRLSEPECEFRTRMKPPSHAGKEDHWWPLGSTQAETEASVQSMIEVCESVGRKHFETIGNFPDVYATIEPEELRDRPRHPLFGMQHSVRLAWSLGMAALYLGQKERARAFAEFGLAGIGRATGLKAMLEAILQKTAAIP